MTLPPLVDLLFQAIIKTTNSASYIRRAHEGKTHEAFLTTGAWALARQSGIDALLVEYKSSSHPIDLENANTISKPAARIDHQERLFVEIQGHLLGVELDYLPQPGIKVLAYQSRDEVETRGLPFHEWKNADVGDALVDAHNGIFELSQKNDLLKVSAALTRMAMEDNTPVISDRAKPGRRL